MKRGERGESDGLDAEGRRLLDMARSVAERPCRIRDLDLLDQLAVALILDRREFLPDGEFTTLQSVHRLGAERVGVAVAVERALMLHFEDEDEDA